MIIDTHLHVWSEDFSRYPFADGSKAADEGAPVELLNDTMDEAGVDKAVIVQPIYYRFDNRYVAECLRRFPDRYAAIGLVDRHAPDAPDQLERLVREDKFGGLRIHLARADDPAEWAAPDQDPIWRRAEDLGSASSCTVPQPTCPLSNLLSPVSPMSPLCSTISAVHPRTKIHHIRCLATCSIWHGIRRSM